MSVKNRLSATTIAILREFRQPNNRVKVTAKFKHLTESQVCGTVNRLKRAGFICDVKVADYKSARTVWLQVTEEGIKAIRRGPQKLDSRDQHSGAYSKAKREAQFDAAMVSLQRSTMHQPTYVPPKDEPTRPGSLAFKSVPSKGLT